MKSVASLFGDLSQLPPGPVALILAEDAAEVASTVAHARNLGFAAVLLLRPPAVSLTEEPWLRQADGLCTTRDTAGRLVTALHRPLAGRWLHVAFNAEYLFFPWCETRSVADLVTFMDEERRAAIHGMVVDLYPESLESAPEGVDRDRACLDSLGYFAFSHRDTDEFPQAEIMGGLHWRFAEHLEQGARLDRPALHVARPGLAMGPDMRLSDPALNAVSCPWHNNVTAAIASFRLAKALVRNPGSAAAIDGFVWEGTRRFDWTGRQLLDHGFMEAGQWF
jgi:hypothetical protein